MSFVDGIFNGIAGAVRGVLGIENGSKSEQSTPERAERSTQLARDSKTSYERPTSTTEPRTTGFSLSDHLRSSTASAQARPSLVDHLRASSERRSTTPESGEPLPGDAPIDHARTSTSPATGARAHVMDAASRSSYGTVDHLTGSSDAAIAARNVQSGIDYFSSTFGRDGVDGAGSGVDVLIDDRSLDESGRERFRGNGGYYSMPDGAGGAREAIHFGTGTSYDAAQGLVDQRSMLHADDLAIHELVHGVIRKETGHLGGEADEAGATNEAIADVMAAAATRDWVIGEDMYTERSAYRNMRNIADPSDSTSVHGLWTSMQQVEAARASGEDVEEHWASGIISTAAQRVQSRFGGDGGWQAVENVFYDAITGARLGDMSFGAVASALRTSAAAVYGAGSHVEQAFDEELRRAGL